MSLRMDTTFIEQLVSGGSSTDNTEGEDLKEIKAELRKQKERTKALQSSVDSQAKLLQLIARRLDPALDITSEQEAAV